MDCDPPDRPTSLPWEPKIVSMGHLRRIATTPVGLDSIPDDDLLEATPYGMGVDDETEYVAVWVTWEAGELRLSFGKFVRRFDFESLVPLRELFRMAPSDASSIADAIDPRHPTPATSADPHGDVAAEASRLAVRWSAGGKPRQATLRLLRSAADSLEPEAVADLGAAVDALGRGDLGRRSRALIVRVLTAVARLMAGGQE